MADHQAHAASQRTALAAVIAQTVARPDAPGVDQLHLFFAVQELQHAIWFDYIQLPIHDAIIGLAPYDVAARDEPNTLSICLFRGRHPYPLVSALVYDLVVLLVYDCTLSVAHGERPYGLVFAREQLKYSGLHLCNVVGHEACVQLEKFGVFAAAVFDEVHAIEPTEAPEEQRVLNVGIYLCLSPAIVRSSELAAKVAQADERATGKQPFLYRSPECQGYLRHFIYYYDARPGRVLVEAVVQRPAGAALHADILGIAVGLCAGQRFCLAPL